MSLLNLIHLTVLRDLELRLMLDPSISLLRLIALVSTYLAITSYTLLVIDMGDIPKFDISFWFRTI